MTCDCSLAGVPQGMLRTEHQLLWSPDSEGPALPLALPTSSSCKSPTIFPLNKLIYFLLEINNYFLIGVPCKGPGRTETTWKGRSRLGTLSRSQTFCKAVACGREEQGYVLRRECWRGLCSFPPLCCSSQQRAALLSGLGCSMGSFKRRNLYLEVLADTPWAQLQ